MQSFAPFLFLPKYLSINCKRKYGKTKGGKKLIRFAHKLTGLGKRLTKICLAKNYQILYYDWLSVR